MGLPTVEDVQTRTYRHTGLTTRAPPTELQRDYTGAAMAADMARKVAERFNDMADNANLAKSYKVAQRYWEEGGHAFVDAARHREE